MRSVGPMDLVEQATAEIEILELQPDTRPASQATGQPASQPAIGNPMENYWESIGIYWKSIEIYWKSIGTNWEVLLSIETIENQPPAPNDRFKIEVQCEMLMGTFSTDVI